MKRLIHQKKSEHGQAFTELAISIVFLLVLLTVMIDLGWAFYTIMSMRDAAQEAAAYASMCPGPANEATIRQRLRLSATAPLDMQDIPAENITIEYLDGTTHAAGADVKIGNSVQISVMVEHKIVVPFAATFIGTDIYPLRVNVADTILRTGDSDGCD